MLSLLVCMFMGDTRRATCWVCICSCPHSDNIHVRNVVDRRSRKNLLMVNAGYGLPSDLPGQCILSRPGCAVHRTMLNETSRGREHRLGCYSDRSRLDGMITTSQSVQHRSVKKPIDCVSVQLVQYHTWAIKTHLFEDVTAIAGAEPHSGQSILQRLRMRTPAALPANGTVTP